MRIGCVLTLVFLGVLAFVYHDWLATVFDPPGSWIGAVVLAILVGLCFGALTNAKAAARDWNLVRRARAGTDTLTDGRPSAVVGTAQPLAQTLRTPFLDKECLAYEYEIFRWVTSRDSKGGRTTNKDLQFSGLALAPTAVETGLGSVHLLGFPDLTALPEIRPNSGDAFRSAREFVERTEFHAITGLVTGYREMREFLTDDDGEVCKNWRHPRAAEAPNDRPTLNEQNEDKSNDEDESDDDYPDEFGDDLVGQVRGDRELVGDGEPLLPVSNGSISLRGSQLMERSIAPGSEIVAIGIYSEERRGLVPSIGRHGALNRVFPGNPYDVQRSFRQKVVRNFCGAVVGLAVVHCAVFFLMKVYLRNPQNIAARSRQFAEAAQQGNLARLEELISRGVSVDCRDASGRTVLMETEDSEIVDFLISHGADVNARCEDGQTAVMEAARMGRTEVLRKLMAAGADLNLRSTRYNTTALMQADGSEQFESAAMLRAAGAFDDVVTAENGTPLPTDGGEPLDVCRKYLKAVYAEDIPTLRKLASRDWLATFDDVDWQGWRDVRSEEPSEFAGFLRGDWATITLAGRTAKNYHTTWVYQLVREGGTWKILRERWATKPPPAAR